MVEERNDYLMYGIENKLIQVRISESNFSKLAQELGSACLSTLF